MHRIQSEEHLRELLTDFATGDARVFSMTGPGGGLAFLGLGGPFAGIRYYGDAASGRSVGATPTEPLTNQDQWFTAVGEPSRVKAAHAMPAGDVIDLAIHLYRTGTLANWVDWT